MDSLDGWGTLLISANRCYFSVSLSLSLFPRRRRRRRRRRLAFTRYLERGCDLLVNIDPREHNSRAQPTERDRERWRDRERERERERGGGGKPPLQTRPHPSAVPHAAARVYVSGTIKLFFATARRIYGTYVWHNLRFRLAEIERSRGAGHRIPADREQHRATRQTAGGLWRTINWN